MLPHSPGSLLPTDTQVTHTWTAGAVALAYPSLSVKPQCEWEMLLTELHPLWLSHQRLCTRVNNITAPRTPPMLSTGGRMHKATFPGPSPGLGFPERNHWESWGLRFRCPGYQAQVLTECQSPHITGHQFLTCKVAGNRLINL